MDNMHKESPIRTRELKAATGSRLTNRGFTRLHHGLWFRDGVIIDEWLRAEALMELYPGSVVTGWHAAVIYGHRFEPEVVMDEVASPGRRIERPGVLGRQYRIPDEHIRMLSSGRPHDIWIASPEWCLFDIARHEPRTEAICALDTSTTMGPSAITRLRPMVEALRGVRGRRIVLDRLNEVNTLAESPWETRTRLFLIENDLTGFVLQHRPRGTNYKLDLSWPEYKVAVEYDGADHRTKKQQAADEIRRNRLRAAGWYIEVVTATSLFRTPKEILFHIQGALRSRGASFAGA